MGITRRKYIISVLCESVWALMGGFQDAYLAVNLAVISWLENTAGNEPLLRIAGHSLGAALATLFAVDIKQRGWQIEGVVTFGSPRVGQRGFKSLYQELGLHHCTVRFANDYDPVPWVPISSLGFEHVVEGYALGSQAPSGNPHSMTGSSTSYLHTLQDAVDGRAVPHIALRGVNLMTDIKARESTVHSVAMQMKQELKVDIAFLRQDVSKLAEGMEAAVQEVKNSVRQVHDWKDVLDMETLIDFVNRYQSQLQTWQHCVPEWFRDYKKQLKRILEAAKLELKDLKSPLAPKFVLLYLHAASFLIAAMGTSGASPRDIGKEFGDFVAAAKGLVSNCFHLPLSLLNEILQLLPRTHDVSSPEEGDVHLSLQEGILKLRGRGSQLGSPLFQLMKWSQEPDMDTLELQLGSEYAGTLLRQLLQHLTSLSLNFSCCDKITDAAVQQLASSMPQNLTSLSLKFFSCHQITDAAVQQLASSMPQNLTSLSLHFGLCHQITGAAWQQLASSMPQNLTSLSLQFSSFHEITDAAVQQLASSMPQNLTSLSLDFFSCNQITDAAVQQLASSMPQNLTSLSLHFGLCHQITDAAVQQLASSMPQNLTSLSLNFSCCDKITDAAVQQLASSMPQNLTSLSLNFSYCNQITDAAVQQLARKMPENLTSLRLESFMHLCSSLPATCGRS